MQILNELIQTMTYDLLGSQVIWLSPQTQQSRVGEQYKIM